jgi:hypothetical protein
MNSLHMFVYVLDNYYSGFSQFINIIGIDNIDTESPKCKCGRVVSVVTFKVQPGSTYFSHDIVNVNWIVVTDHNTLTRVHKLVNNMINGNIYSLHTKTVLYNTKLVCDYDDSTQSAIHKICLVSALNMQNNRHLITACPSFQKSSLGILLIVPSTKIVTVSDSLTLYNFHFAFSLAVDSLKYFQINLFKTTLPRMLVNVSYNLPIKHKEQPLQSSLQINVYVARGITLLTTQTNNPQEPGYYYCTRCFDSFYILTLKDCPHCRLNSLTRATCTYKAHVNPKSDVILVTPMKLPITIQKLLPILVIQASQKTDYNYPILYVSSYMENIQGCIYDYI